MNIAARLEAVERENDVLRGRIALLEAAAFGAVGPPVAFALTASEARMFGMLMARTEASKNALMAALYHNAGRDEAEPKIIDVFICKMRKKLKPFGVSIETLWGRGYAIAPATKDIVRAMLPKQEDAA